jgi:serine/threonine protein kinase/tetratricopeptide (TPR) repeat protein
MMDFTGDSQSEQDDQTAFGGPGLRVPAKADSSSNGVPSDPGGKPSRDFGADPHADFGATIGDAHAIREGSVSERPPSGNRPPDPSYRDVTVQIGDVIGGRYEILQLLGEGGMGTVYKARDTELDRLVGLKIIRPDLATNPEILQRFKQELILARQVTHRNVIRIFDLSQADGLKFITMEYLEGQDLRAVLREKGKLTPQEAARVILQICRALEAAHSEGVIHRDLKPQNIMLDQKGRAYVMDFGIARSAYLPGMTQTGALVGTPEYMSPEQAKGEKLDERSDLFSLGVILYELLVGQSPYYSDTPLATLWKRIQEKAKPLSELDPTIPKSLSDIIEKALEIDPRNRFSSAHEFALSLESWLGPSAESSTIFLPAPRTTPYWKWATAALAVVVISALVAFVLKNPSKPKAAHAPVSVLVADFTNHTGDPIFDDTLEPMFNVALEGASFVNAFSRGDARKLAQQLPHPTDKLDEQPARLVAINQGISAVITGELSRRGDKYNLSATALDAVSGNVIAKVEATAANKDEVLLAIPKLAAPIRKALGDTTPESVQLNSTVGAFTAASLEAVHEYGVGEELAFAGKTQEALQAYAKAAELDPNFARAYAGESAVAANLGQFEDSEKYAKLAMEHIDRMTDHERYRVRGLYYMGTSNWQKCVEEYGELINRHPADNIAYGNLAGCYVELRNFPKALEVSRRAVEIAPQVAQLRFNLSFYSSYAGDFQTGEREARKIVQLMPSHDAYLALAESQLGLGQLAQAAETYHNLQKLSAIGASTAASGLADLAVYEGRFSDAGRILESGAAADLKAKRPENAANKYAALSRTHLLLGQKQAALSAAEKALANSQAMQVKFLAGQTFVEAGEAAKGEKLAATLAAEVQAEPQAYAKIIEGDAALSKGDARQAIKALTEANNLLDTWIGRFELGRAYLQAGLFVESDAEFEKCIKRRGEALEILLNNVPAYGYFPPVYYYQGRAREGMNSPGSRDSYRTYLSIREKAGDDHLLPEIRRRLGQ